MSRALVTELSAMLHHPAGPVVGDEGEESPARVGRVLLMLVGVLLHLRHVRSDFLLHVGGELADHLFVSAHHNRSLFRTRRACDVENGSLFTRRQYGVEFCGESFMVWFL
jgi:hypothetical protein